MLDENLFEEIPIDLFYQEIVLEDFQIDLQLNVFHFVFVQ